MDDIGLDLEESDIKNMKKHKFKQLVNEKIRESAHSYLILKKESLSKLNNLSSAYYLKDYLKTDRLTTAEKQLLFNLRTRMVPVKCNYSAMYEDDLSCQLCDTNANESQEHLLFCPSLADSVQSYQATTAVHIQYMDIFHENLEKQISAVKLWSILLKLRRIKLYGK